MEADTIVLHCSATRDSGTVSWNAIRRYHVETRGWRDIGYHFGIEQVGEKLAILRGRNTYDAGAHCRAGGYNSHSIGVCLVGDYDEYPPDPYRMNVTVDLLTKLCFILSIPAKNIIGHREKEPGKTCPGLAWNLDRLRARVYNNLMNENDDILDVHQWTQYIGDTVFWRKELV